MRAKVRVKDAADVEASEEVAEAARVAAEVEAVEAIAMISREMSSTWTQTTRLRSRT